MSDVSPTENHITVETRPFLPLDVEFPARVLCILGMHRSGTSCLTGSLQEAGLALGDCHTWNMFNRKGNRENQAFVDLNDAVLAANGAAWDSPPHRVVWSAHHLDEGAKLLRAQADKDLFGFKDPRTILVLEGWKKIYPDMEFVGIFRHPAAVAASLAYRNEMPTDEALSLWYGYNNRLLSEYMRKPFPLLCFDEEELVIKEKMARVAGVLGLDGSPDRQHFFSNELRSSEGTVSSRLPWKVSRLYKKLRKSSI